MLSSSSPSSPNNLPLALPSPSSSTMAYFKRPSSMDVSSGISPGSTGSKTSCGLNCSCRTVSSVGSTAPRFARVQLHPYEQKGPFESPSDNFSNDDLLEDFDASDAFKQDFDFNDLFNYDHNENSATSSDDNSGCASLSKPKSQTDFFFSHYAGHMKGAGHVKMTKTKSGLLRPRVAKVKNGCRRAGCRQFHEP
jgi:hypothetical protein